MPGSGLPSFIKTLSNSFLERKILHIFHSNCYLRLPNLALDFEIPYCISKRHGSAMKETS